MISLSYSKQSLKFVFSNGASNNWHQYCRDELEQFIAQVKPRYSNIVTYNLATNETVAQLSSTFKELIKITKFGVPLRQDVLLRLLLT